MDITEELCANCNHSRNEHNRFCHHEEIHEGGSHHFCSKNCEGFVEQKSGFDRALSHAIACIGIEDSFDRLEAGEYETVFFGCDDFSYDDVIEGDAYSRQDIEDAPPDFLDDDCMDIDIPRLIPNVTLNGGPVFEDFDE